MRTILSIFMIIFVFQSWTKADDMRDFQIEGISLGESALNYFSKSILEKNKQHDWFNSKKFIPIAELTLSNSITYESFQIAVKNKDQNYKIEMLAGFVFYKDNIDECYDKIDTIAYKILSWLLRTLADQQMIEQKHLRIDLFYLDCSQLILIP